MSPGNPAAETGVWEGPRQFRETVDFRRQVMNHYSMKALGTLTITEKGQAQFPASWRK